MIQTTRTRLQSSRQKPGLTGANWDLWSTQGPGSFLRPVLFKKLRSVGERWNVGLGHVPVTSLHNGETEVQSGSELTSGHTECVPEAALN